MNSKLQSRRLPPLNSIRAFEAAARHLSFTRAAEELFVTQAAVSHQVKTLEEWLGLPLFRRRNRQVFLTEAGQSYLPAVREALDGLSAATRRLVEQDAGGTLTVSLLPSFAAKWLVPRLRGFRERHPDIEVRIDADDKLVDFSRDDVDIGIRYGAGGWPGVEATKFLTEDRFPVCSPDLLRGPHPLRSPADLKHQTLLHDDTRDDWRAWLLAAGIDDVDPRYGHAFNDSSMLLEAAIDGQGVALARGALASRDLSAGRLVKPFDVELPARYAYYIVHAPGAGQLPKIRAFVDWLLSVVAAEEPEASDL